DVLFVEPGTNFEYLTSARFGRSERLIALLVPRSGDPVIVAPAFEVERVRRATHLKNLIGWEEAEDPYAKVGAAVARMPRRSRRIGIEASTRYAVFYALGRALPDWIGIPAEPVLGPLRIKKSPAEVAMIRRGVEITEAAIAVTFARLDTGMTDRDVARLLSDEMRNRGAEGGGLVQFGPTSALPHGGTEGRRLELGMPVLIDAGCQVHSYTSDITRMHFFGSAPPAKYVEVYNTVLGAQTAAVELARPGVECQALDRVARQVIEQAGYGRFFTHRLGHGIGMDGHEPPYLVEGNELTLEPGMTFTIEPGIYLPGEWGVRIEDDFVVTKDGLQPLSTRASAI
ncbi:MAG: M24 family metallopeptidase, partial [Gemmatimonadota bacterium]